MSEPAAPAKQAAWGLLFRHGLLGGGLWEAGSASLPAHVATPVRGAVMAAACTIPVTHSVPKQGKAGFSLNR